MKESLRHFLLKSKRFLRSRDFVLVLVIILISLASFGLGRMSASGVARSPVSVGYPDISSGEVAVRNKAAATVAVVAAANSNSNSSTQVVASKNGTKYHLPTCPGAAQISEANKIYFNSPAEAEAAGYEKASNCKGL